MVAVDLDLCRQTGTDQASRCVHNDAVGAATAGVALQVDVSTRFHAGVDPDPKTVARVRANARARCDGPSGRIQAAAHGLAQREVESTGVVVDEAAQASAGVVQGDVAARENHIAGRGSNGFGLWNQNVTTDRPHGDVAAGAEVALKPDGSTVAAAQVLSDDCDVAGAGGNVVVREDAL